MTEFHKQTISYLQESKKLLLIFPVHIILLKQHEVWDKSIAWSNVPGIQKKDIPSVDVHLSPLPLGSCLRFPGGRAKPHSILQRLCRGSVMSDENWDVCSVVLERPWRETAVIAKGCFNALMKCCWLTWGFTIIAHSFKHVYTAVLSSWLGIKRI